MLPPVGSSTAVLPRDGQLQEVRWHDSCQLPVPGDAVTLQCSSPVLEQGLAGLLHAAGPWETGMYLGFVQLLAQQGPWSGTAAVLVLVGMQSPGEAAWDGDVQRADVQRAGDVQDVAGVQLLEVIGSLL